MKIVDFLWDIIDKNGGKTTFNRIINQSLSCVSVSACASVGGLPEDDISVAGVIEMRSIDETSAVMNFSQLIHQFPCK